MAAAPQKNFENLWGSFFVLKNKIFSCNLHIANYCIYYKFISLNFSFILNFKNYVYFCNRCVSVGSIIYEFNFSKGMLQNMVIKSDKLDKDSTGTYLGQNKQSGEETWKQIVWETGKK